MACCGINHQRCYFVKGEMGAVDARVFPRMSQLCIDDNGSEGSQGNGNNTNTNSNSNSSIESNKDDKDVRST